MVWCVLTKYKPQSSQSGKRAGVLSRMMSSLYLMCCDCCRLQTGSHCTGDGSVAGGLNPAILNLSQYSCFLVSFTFHPHLSPVSTYTPSVVFRVVVVM